MWIYFMKKQNSIFTGKNVRYRYWKGIYLFTIQDIGISYYHRWCSGSYNSLRGIYPHTSYLSIWGTTTLFSLNNLGLSSGWQGGSGKVKICPRMAWIWLLSRPEAPKLVNEPWNGPKWFPQLPVIDLSPFPDSLKHCSHYILKKYQFYYIVKIIDFWNFNFHRFKRPNDPFFGGFLNFP